MAETGDDDVRPRPRDEAAADSASDYDVARPSRAVKRVVPWVLLALVGLSVWSLYGRYRENQAAYDPSVGKTPPALIATPTTTPKKAAEPSASTVAPRHVVALVNVNFHKQPSGSADSYRTLKRGEQVVLLGQVGPWYKVRDASGVVGWVAAGSQYTKIVEGK